MLYWYLDECSSQRNKTSIFVRRQTSKLQRNQQVADLSMSLEHIVFNGCNRYGCYVISLTHLCSVTHICISELGQYWLVASSALNHYLKQCCFIVNCTPGNKFQWNLNQNSVIFIQENAFEIVVCQNGGHFVQGQISWLAQWWGGCSWPGNCLAPA